MSRHQPGLILAIVAAALSIAPGSTSADTIIIEDEVCDEIETCDQRTKPTEIGSGDGISVYGETCGEFQLPVPPPGEYGDPEMNYCAAQLDGQSSNFDVYADYPPPTFVFTKTDGSPMDCLGLSEGDPMMNTVTIQIEEAGTNELSTVAKIYKFAYLDEEEPAFGMNPAGWLRVTLNHQTFSYWVDQEETEAEVNAAVEQAIATEFDIDAYTDDADLPYWIVEALHGDIWKVRVSTPDIIPEMTVELRAAGEPHGGDSVCE